MTARTRYSREELLNIGEGPRQGPEGAGGQLAQRTNNAFRQMLEAQQNANDPALNGWRRENAPFAGLPNQIQLPPPAPRAVAPSTLWAHF
ncbi:MAG: hypothetical protein ACOYK9_04350 [Chlamydiia bacterium]